MQSNLLITFLSLSYRAKKKKLNPSFPFRQVALKFCLPWASLSLLFFDFGGC